MMELEAAQEKFLDLLEGRLSESEAAELRALIDSSSEIKRAFEQYQTLMQMEQAIASQAAVLGPDFSVKVMDKLEGYAPGKYAPGKIGRFEAFMKLQKKFMYGAALAATACVALVLVNRIRYAEGPEEREQRIKEQESFQTPTFNDTLVRNAVGNLHEMVESPLAEFAELFAGSEDKDETVVAEKQLEEQLSAVASADSSGQGADLAQSVQQPLQKAVPFKDLLRNKVASTAPIGAAPAPSAVAGLRADAGNYSYDNRRSNPSEFARSIPTSPTTPYGYGETYAEYEENPRVAVSSQSVSTFSIDVDTGSYTNVRRFLSMGQLPPPNAVRIEEFINYFDYNYPQQTEQPFGVYYEIAPSPLDNGRHLLKVGLRARDVRQDSEKGWNLVFLVDVSGSMADANKLDLVKQSLKVLAEQMREQDRIAIVTYAGEAGVALESTSGKDKAKIKIAIDGLGTGGGTNGAGGIDAAYKVAEQNRVEGGVNRIILATDGDFNVGVYDFEGLKRLIEQKRKTGITLTTIGVGTGNYNEQNLEQLANKGNGQYFYFDSFKEARHVLQNRLTATIEMVAKDVKLQIEFNPAHVAQYRLVGYDNRKLANEDFHNDQVDAGEIGSGHTVTALYELVLANSELAKNLGDDLRYQDKKPEVAAKVEAQKTDELGFLKIRYKEPNSDTSKLIEYPIKATAILSTASAASDDFRFAAAVTYFGAILRDSKYKGSYTLSDVAKLARDAKGSDANGARQEMIELVENAVSVSR